MWRLSELADGGRLLLDETWLGSADAGVLFAALHDEVPWRQERIVIAGRRIPQPRLTAWFGDAPYTYSGLTMAVHPWSPRLAELKATVEDATGARFNGLLANLYRDERDTVGFHADAEPELGENPVIASASLGATRRFVLKHRKSAVPAIEMSLVGGSLLVMAGTTQHFWRHALPRQTAPAAPRINLTFRYVHPAPPRHAAPAGRAGLVCR